MRLKGFLSVGKKSGAAFIISMMILPSTFAVSGLEIASVDLQKIDPTLLRAILSEWPHETSFVVTTHFKDRPDLGLDSGSAFIENPKIPPMWKRNIDLAMSLASGGSPWPYVDGLTNSITQMLTGQAILEMATSRFVKDITLAPSDEHADFQESSPHQYNDPAGAVWCSSVPGSLPPPGGPLPVIGCNDAADTMTRLSQAHQSGFDGDGITIGIIDTGVTLNHPSLQGRIATWANGPAGALGAVYDLCDDKDMIPNNNKGENGNSHLTVDDFYGHGTALASLMVGKDLGANPAAPNFLGYAYNAKLAVAKAAGCIQIGQNPPEDFLNDPEARGIAAMKFLVLTDFNGDGHTPDVQVIEMAISITYAGWMGRGDLDVVANWVVSQGVVFVAPIGNSGDFQLDSPGVAVDVIGVGAVDFNGALAGYSSGGPAGDGRRKPDLVAPGGTQNDRFRAARIDGTYGYSSLPLGEPFSGTSMAAPIVAAAVACLLEANPGWVFRPAQVKAALIMSAEDADQPTNTKGYGLLDVWVARNVAEFPDVEILTAWNTGMVDGEPDVAAAGGKLYLVSDFNIEQPVPLHGVRVMTSVNYGVTWSDSTAILSVDEDSPATKPKIAAFGNKVYAVGLDRKDHDGDGTPDGRLSFSFSFDSGDTWRASGNAPLNSVQTIYTPPLLQVGADWPDVAADSNGVYVVFAATLGGSTEVYFMRSIDDGTTWSTPTQLSDNDPKRSDQPSISADTAPGIQHNGELVVAWLDWRYPAPNALPTSQVFLKWSRNGGVSWNNADLPMSYNVGALVPTWNARRPVVSISAGTYALTWADNREEGVQVPDPNWVPNGNPVTLVPDPGDALEKVLVQIWRWSSAQGDFYQVLRTTPLTFSQLVTLGKTINPVVAVRAPSASSTNVDVYIAFQRTMNPLAGAREDLWMKKANNAGVTWFPSNDLSLQTDYIENLPSIAASDLYVYITWREVRTSSTYVNLAVLDDPTYGML